VERTITGKTKEWLKKPTEGSYKKERRERLNSNATGECVRGHRRLERTW
jgi:hypothetical protein